MLSPRSESVLFFFSFKLDDQIIHTLSFFGFTVQVLWHPTSSIKGGL